MNKILSIFVFIILTSFLAVNAFENDFLVDTYLTDDIEEPTKNTNYDYTSLRRLSVKMKVKKRLSTTDKTIYEGQPVELEVQNNVVYKNKILVKKGETVTARIETIVSSGMNGIPYSIYLGDFKIPNLEQSKLLANYHKSGANRTYLVLPLKWALTFLPPTGSLTNFIMGGHAKIKEKEVITVYYYPEWK